jgi:hypothetical protein
MRAAIDTEPAPSAAPGLGAGNHPRAGTASTAFISLPIGAAQCGGWRIDLDKLIRERSCRNSSGKNQHAQNRHAQNQIAKNQQAIGGKGSAHRRFKEAHHVH